MVEEVGSLDYLNMHPIAHQACLSERLPVNLLLVFEYLDPPSVIIKYLQNRVSLQGILDKLWHKLWSESLE